MAQKRFLDDAYIERSTEEMRDFYDRWAEIYDEEVTENAYAQPQRCAAALKALIGEATAPVIDIGCGTGLSGLALREAGFSSIDGCDLSPGMLEKADTLGIYRRLFEADLNHPPLDVADGAYAGLVAVGVFSFGHVTADAIDEFLRITKPGAPIVIGMNDHYYQEGSVPNKLRGLEKAGRLERLGEKEGDHLPGIGLSGWVLTARRR